MKVLLIGNYPHDNQESMQRFAALMVEALTRRGISVELIIPPPILGRFCNGAHGLGKWLGYVDKFVLFPRMLRRRIAEDLRDRRLVVHVCDHSNSPFVSALDGVPHLITVHDLLAVRSALGEFPQNPTRWSGRILQSMIHNGLRQGQFAVCDSEATRGDLLRLTDRRSEVTGKVLLALNHSYTPMTKVAANAVLDPLFARLDSPFPHPFLLHAGGDAWYKNRAGVLQIFSATLDRESQSDLALVMAGAPPSDGLRKLARSLGIESHVHWAGKVSNEELQALYSRAEALVFPSLTEGFGWPPLEAQACGCLLITSDRASLPEVVGEGALFIDPEDPADGARAVQRVLQMSPTAREEMRERGFQNVQRFSVDQMVDGYLDVYERVAEVAESRGSGH